MGNIIDDLECATGSTWNAPQAPFIYPHIYRAVALVISNIMITTTARRPIIYYAFPNPRIRKEIIQFVLQIRSRSPILQWGCTDMRDTYHSHSNINPITTTTTTKVLPTLAWPLPTTTTSCNYYQHYHLTTFKDLLQDNAGH